MKSFLLSFDVEEFNNPYCIEALFKILKILRKLKIKAIFFITLEYAERIKNNKKLIEELKNHFIGYHGKTHLFPYIYFITDTGEYISALERVIIEERENIDRFKKIFSLSSLNSFRAPGFSFSPVHLEGMRELGFTYDFSTFAFKRPTLLKGIIFYPNSRGSLFITEEKIIKRIRFFLIFLFDLLLKNPVILQWHPFDFVLKGHWMKKEGEKISFSFSLLSEREKRRKFKNLYRFIRIISLLQRAGILFPFSFNLPYNSFKKVNTEKVFLKARYWLLKYWNISPLFLRRHIEDFFKTNT